MYANGLGVTQDYKEAVKWYRLAAEQGDTSAQFNLGLMYAKGQSMPEDILQAHKWFNLAAAAGDEDAQKNRKFAESKMSHEQIEKAQTLAREWLAKRN